MDGEALVRAGDRLTDASEQIDNAFITEQLASLAERCTHLSERNPSTNQLARLETTIRSTSNHLDGTVAITVRRAGQDVIVYREQRE